MRRTTVALLLALGLAGLLAGCGAKRTAQSTATSTPAVTTETAPTETAPAQEMTLRIYFLSGGRVVPVSRRVPQTAAVGGASLEALGRGPTDEERARGLSTALPPGPSFQLSARDGTISVSGAEGLSREALAQLVYTLTQFPSVQAVEVAGRRLTRVDFELQTPAILVETPLPGDTVTSPLHVSGTADTFEATFTIRLVAGGRTIAEQVVTATSGSGQRGTYDATLPFSGSGPATLVAFEPSAADGRPLHTVEVPLTLG